MPQIDTPSSYCVCNSTCYQLSSHSRFCSRRCAENLILFSKQTFLALTEETHTPGVSKNMSVITYMRTFLFFSAFPYERDFYSIKAMRAAFAWKPALLETCLPPERFLCTLPDLVEQPFHVLSNS